jgi:uncharacterized membrane protein YdfJ with MMPL/SSD domain
MFAFLFGISMDYEVFVLARMREIYDATGDTRKAIIGAIGRTGRNHLRRAQPRDLIRLTQHRQRHRRRSARDPSHP